jgi:D-glycero-D-manno-heptose 1,7-bisphosphate phosphatase
MKLVVLDRDGVINEDSDDYIKSADEWIPIPGSLEAIARLSQAGWHVVVASNQSGLARGLFGPDELLAMHRKMNALLERLGGRIEAIFFCPHGPQEDCDCRKPKPGLLEQIAERYQVSLHGVPVVGDSLRDLAAALAVGAAPVLVRTGKGRRTLRTQEVPEGTPIYDDLAQFVERYLAERGAEA